MSPRDIPIIFSAPMVQALLEGRKTQTRRLAWRVVRKDIEFRGKTHDLPTAVAKTPWQNVKPGDRLWVRENHAIVPQTAYRASEGVQQTVCPTDPDMAAIYACGWERSAPKWKPSIHMPRWASRLTLIITGARVERLQDISDQDAMAEGIGPSARDSARNGGGVRMWGWPGMDGVGFHTPRGAFDALWTGIHGPKSWFENPELVVLTFVVWECNIDSVPAEMTEAELMEALEALSPERIASSAETNEVGGPR